MMDVADKENATSGRPTTSSDSEKAQIRQLAEELQLSRSALQEADLDRLVGDGDDALSPADRESGHGQKVQKKLRKPSACGLLRSKKNANARPEGTGPANAISRPSAGTASDSCRAQLTGRAPIEANLLRAG